jgi:anti-sigma factor RsiW
VTGLLIKRLLRRRHPRSRVFSQYLDGELVPSERRALEAHLLDCDGCRRDLAALSQTIDALGALNTEPTPGLADSVIAALRLEDPARNGAGGGPSNAASSPALVAGEAGRRSPGAPTANGAVVRVAGVLRYCLRRAQLRLTLPVALLAGAAISLINQGSMIFNGEVTVGMCAICALNFLVPFVALNLGLAMAVGVVRRRRT